MAEQANTDCLFCRFVTDGSKHEQTVYEDDRVVAFLDDFPITEGHTLVVLKDHYPDLASVAPCDAAEMGRVVALVAKALKTVLGVPIVYTASLGEAVQHVHFHLIPRRESDAKGFCHFLTPRGALSDDTGLAHRIRQELEVFTHGTQPPRK